MAKSTCLLALFVVIVVYVEALRIDPVQPATRRRGKYFPEIKRNDPRCHNRSGKFPILGDCTRYLKCVNGDSQEIKCPEDFKFDSTRHCTPPGEDPDCGRRTISGPLEDNEVCPEAYGVFPVKSDCHRYMVCRDGKPNFKVCPQRYIYRDSNGGCVPGNKCSTQSSDEYECKSANQLLPDKKNCRRYIKCINFQPLKKECPPGKAFDPDERRCTKEQLEKCRNNDILNVARNE